MVAEIDIDLLRKLLRYDPESGKLYWLPRPLQMFANEGHGGPSRICLSWNAKWAGKEAFTAKTDEGYCTGRILRKTYRAHRVAWALMHGCWPPEQIDHINGDKSDNRASNLREATNAENQRNRGPQANNTSGFKGVTYYRKGGRWQAQIKVDGRVNHIGYFDTPEAAYAAYCAANRERHGEFGRVA